MKVLNIYPEGATKLCHRKSGDVVRIHKNDISIPDNEIYIYSNYRYKRRWSLFN